jgi:hypothetical protein
MYRSPLLLVVSVGALATAGCNPFRSPFKQAPVVAVSTRDANANARWSATLASPANLVGAVQMKGSATMTPGPNAGNTAVSVDLSNASPGGVHPWQLRRGQCGMDDGTFGEADAYKSLKVDDQGHASSAVTVPLVMPTEGNYYVRVSASAANPETIVACGNLAAPSR